MLFLSIPLIPLTIHTRQNLWVEDPRWLHICAAPGLLHLKNDWSHNYDIGVEYCVKHQNAFFKRKDSSTNGAVISITGANVWRTDDVYLWIDSNRKTTKPNTVGVELVPELGLVATSVIRKNGQWYHDDWYATTNRLHLQMVWSCKCYVVLSSNINNIFLYNIHINLPTQQVQQVKFHLQCACRSALSMCWLVRGWLWYLKLVSVAHLLW